MPKRLAALAPCRPLCVLILLSGGACSEPAGPPAEVPSDLESLEGDYLYQSQLEPRVPGTAVRVGALHFAAGNASSTYRLNECTPSGCDFVWREGPIAGVEVGAQGSGGLRGSTPVRFEMQPASGGLAHLRAHQGVVRSDTIVGRWYEIEDVTGDTLTRGHFTSVPHLR